MIFLLKILYSFGVSWNGVTFMFLYIDFLRSQFPMFIDTMTYMSSFFV